MNQKVLSRRGVAGVALAAITAIALAACGSGQPSTTPQGSAATGIEGASGELKGSGASFPNAFYQEIVAELQGKAKNLKVTYNSVGSSTGKKEFAQGLVDFAGSDSLVKDSDGIAKDSFYYLPTVAAPITVSYNLQGVDKLQLSAATVAKIFQRDIKTWNDPAIAADNPGVTLPATAITVAHRTDGSGTTANFTKYLTVAAKDTWKLGTGDTVEWSADTQGGAKNTGVAQIVTQVNGAIGYVDLSDATTLKLKFAAIKNKDGKFVLPTLEGTTAGLNGAKVNDDLSYDPLDASGADAYPITAPTFLLVKRKYDDPKKAELVKAFVKYMLTDGQALAKEVHFAPLPDSLKQKALAQLDKVS
ncbi:phosphate ABC transporter substrate-binding protein PstS [Allorhizocola rhizosphaerae]|uniref:phosphate ABC transporter substrate-binding protein PstS n=1 Tax=Allorhizocola rhizosphaerae TaxID=1872709 RepID=UPI000E3D3DC7|nr:phosphate ABC transporter substrate-binding protein PstS [Allorhizocola rhizosphaerae]